MSVGDDGPLRCLRSQIKWSSPSKPKEMDMKDKPVQSECDWGAESDGSDGWGQDDTWGGAESDDKEITICDLESLLEKCDTGSGKKENKKDVVVFNKVEAVMTHNDERKTTSPGFEQFDLDMVYEPVVDKSHDEDEDDEMIVDGCDDIDATKIDQMLSKYMSQEDDDEILGMLKGGTSGSNSSSAPSGKKDKSDEKYERLPPEERALISFTSRLRRVPQQVSRYAWGGEALWSTPVLTQAIRKQQAKQKPRTSKFSALPDVPKCACGAKRWFEFQLLPSILHKLEVDSQVGVGEACNDMMELIEAGGMNWGNVAIFSCSNSCEQFREEFIIVQESVSDTQQKRSTRDTDDDAI